MVQEYVIGTPGRLHDMITKDTLCIDTVNTFIMDDVDELFERGYKDTIYDIFRTLPERIQVCMFSCSELSAELVDTTKRLMNNPKYVIGKKVEEITLADVMQFRIMVEREKLKINTLCVLLASIETNQTVIFCNTQRIADTVLERLQREKFSVRSLTAQMANKSRYLL